MEHFVPNTHTELQLLLLTLEGAQPIVETFPIPMWLVDDTHSATPVVPVPVRKGTRQAFAYTDRVTGQSWDAATGVSYPMAEAWIDQAVEHMQRIGNSIEVSHETQE